VRRRGRVIAILKCSEIKIMKRQFLMFLALIGACSACIADDEAARAGYETAKKQADNRYSDDQKICADESSSSRRMQCLRDAKEERAKALAAAESKLGAESGAGQRAARCNDCGKVIAVRVSEKEGEAGAVGLIAGGVAGALLGHQVGKGTGKDLATIAGAAGGAYAGHKVEGKMKATKTWAVSVRFENGDEGTYSFDHDPGFSAGDPVKAAGSSIVRR
jgi:outer membrane lipoprotein SlyB